MFKYVKFLHRFNNTSLNDTTSHNQNGQVTIYNNPENTFVEADIQKYPLLFHKYLLGLSSYNTQIPYNVISSSNINKPYICHFHIHNINLYDEYIIYIDRIKHEFDVIITYNIGEKHIDNNVTVLQVENRGFDIGPKLCMLQFLVDKSINYECILFLHSQSDKDKRNQLFDPLIKNIARIKLVKSMIEVNKNLLGIFPNWCFKGKKVYVNNTYNPFKANHMYFNEILNFLNIGNRQHDFSAGNCMVLRRKIIDRIFNNYLKIFYNILNEKDSFDLNWYRIRHNLKIEPSPEFAYNHFKSSTSKIGNNFSLMKSQHSMPDGMIEHVFERIWLNVIKEMYGDYMILSSNNAIDNYKIKLNAIYFPQFHEIPENNKFWGKNFTEWTLLKPYQDKIKTSFGEIPIYKPHTDIGYYDLSVKETLLKQISIAKSYNINGFIIYHYWFNKDKIVMNRPLEYFLNNDIHFPFSISWANENWTKRWDGCNNDILLEQTYSDHLEHIRYLIPFFKRPNYIRNANNENIFYIYNISFIPNYEEMVTKWTLELDKHGLKIKIIGTNNSFTQNHANTINNTRYLFEPTLSGGYANMKTHDKENSWSYKELVNLYVQDKIVCPQPYPHFGLPLYWNNIVRRKDIRYDLARDFNMTELERFLYTLLAKIILRYKNRLDIENLQQYENFININAWNEWNEQAVLEPNNITGYLTLETIKNAIHDL